MARNRIGRSIATTTCKGEYYASNDQKSPFSVTVYGHYDVSQMTRKVKRILKTDRFLIDPESIEYSEFWCSMPVDKFVELGEHSSHKPEKE